MKTPLYTQKLAMIGDVIPIGSNNFTVYEWDENDRYMKLSGTAANTALNSRSGFAKGCIYIKTNAAGGVSGLYENTGTTSSSTFTAFAGGGVTAFTGLSDVPASYVGQAAKIVNVNAGETALTFVALSGDATITAGGVVSVSHITIAGEAQGDLYYRNATTTARLAAGTNGYILKTQGAGANPIWVDPATLPMGTATKLSQNFDIEGGANDITVATTTQTVGAVTLTMPDFASVADTFAFITLAQLFKNKGLEDNTTTFRDNADNTKRMRFECSGVTAGQTRVLTSPDFDGTIATLAGTETFTNKTLSGNVATGFVYSAGGNAITFQNAVHTVVGRDTTDTLTNKTIASFLQGPGNTITVPAASDTLVGKATTDTFTNKTFNADGAGNVLQNVNADELDPITGNTYTVPFTIKYLLSNQAAAVNIFNANAPFKFQVIRAHSLSTSADGGTWKLNNGALGAGTDITGAVTVAASSGDLDEAASGWSSIANRTIAANGSLSIVPDGAGVLDCEIYITCLRVD